jgi:hypothetical protein
MIGVRKTAAGADVVPVPVPQKGRVVMTKEHGEEWTGITVT